jgi:hypothetical protein
MGRGAKRQQPRNPPAEQLLRGISRRSRPDRRRLYREVPVAHSDQKLPAFRRYSSEADENYTDPKVNQLDNVFASQVLALRLNVDFSNAGKLPQGLSALKLRTGKFAGWTVFDVLSTANFVLGGGQTPLNATISDLNVAVTTINENFADGRNKGNLVP